MRTTVTLDPDAEQIIRGRMEAEGISFKRALNDAIRAGDGDHPKVRVSYTRARSLGEPRIDLTKALQLVGELEDESILRRMRSR